MKTILILMSVVVGASSLASSTAPALAAGKAANAGRCFYMQEVRNHTIGDDHTLYLNVGGKSVYRVEMSNNCFGGSSPNDAIVLKERGTSNICTAIDLDVSATLNGGGLPSRCIVDTLTKMTPAEVAALPKKVQP
jgi:hypothetical protein